MGTAADAPTIPLTLRGVTFHIPEDIGIPPEGSPLRHHPGGTVRGLN